MNGPMSAIFRVTAGIILATAVTACNPLVRNDAATLTYRLTPSSPGVDAWAGLPQPLVFDPVGVPAALDTDRILISRGDQRLDHYADARWAAPLPAILIDSLARMLGDKAMVASPDTSALPDHSRLRLYVRDFQAHYAVSVSDRPPWIQIGLTFTLVDTTGHVTARSHVEMRRRAPENRLNDVVVTFEGAFRDAVDQGLSELAENHSDP